MIKRLPILLTILLVGLLSACSSPVTITPDKIDVVFDNPRYEGEHIIVDVWITNGTEYDEYIESVDFWFELPEGTDVTGFDSNEVCGAQFDILEYVKADKYNEYELEFSSEFIYITESDLTALNLTLEDLEFFYLFDVS